MSFTSGVHISLINKIVLAIIIVMFLMFNLFGLVYSVNNMASHNNVVSNCLFISHMDELSICPMNLTEHLNMWRLMFNAIISKISLMNIIFLTFFYVFITPIIKINIFLNFYVFSFLYSRYKIYLKQNPHMLLFNKLKEVFSSGILNPKI